MDEIEWVNSMARQILVYGVCQYANDVFGMQLEPSQVNRILGFVDDLFATILEERNRKILLLPRDGRTA